MKKIDYKKELSVLYKAASNPVFIDVPKLNYLMIEGVGDPNTSVDYKNAVEALYPVAYTIKFMIKKNKDIDYGVMPLEGLWWVDDMTKFSVDDKKSWKWNSMIMQPEIITKEHFKKAIEIVKEKKDLAAIDKIKFETYNERKCAQILHTGPFSEEGPTIQTLHNFISESGYKKSGKHHEIYLSDIRKAAPEKWKTIIRQPISK